MKYVKDLFKDFRTLPEKAKTQFVVLRCHLEKSIA